MGEEWKLKIIYVLTEKRSRTVVEQWTVEPESRDVGISVFSQQLVAKRKMEMVECRD